MEIPSEAALAERVETWWRPSHWDDGKVQTTNGNPVAKAIVVRNPLVPGSSPGGGANYASAVTLESHAGL